MFKMGKTKAPRTVNFDKNLLEFDSDHVKECRALPDQDSDNSKEYRAGLSANSSNVSWLEYIDYISHLIKRLVSKYQYKIGSKLAASDNPKISDLISKLNEIDVVFTDKRIDNKALTIEQLPGIAQELECLATPESGESFPDPRLQQRTWDIVDEIKRITPPQVELYAKNQAAGKEILVSFTSSSVQFPFTFSYETPKEDTADERCCWNPLRLIFG